MHYPLLVLGGSGFTIFPEEILTALKADFGIIGEGERLLLLLDAIENKTDPSHIPGVINPATPCRIPPPIDQVIVRPIVAAEGHHQFYLQHGGMLNLQTQRGCLFRCVYCTYPHIEDRRMRLIPPSDVAETAARLVDRGAKYLFITDSAFNANLDHSAAVAQAFIRADIRVPWGCFLAPIAAPKGYFRLLAKAGLTHVEFGTESLSNPVLKAYGKPFKSETVLKTHERAVAAGLNVAHYILLGGPGETRQTIEETLFAVEKLKKTVIFIFSGMRIYPHTALYDIACREGQITADQNLLKPIFYQPPGIDSARIMEIIHAQAQKHHNWIFNDGGDGAAAALAVMYRRDYYGPLWERLIQ